MEKDQKIAWWRYILAVVAYGVLFFVGGAVLILWNALSPMRYRFVPGDLGYSIMQILTGPFGVLLANYASTKILQEKRSIMPFVLNIIGAALAAVLALFPWLASGNFTRNTLSILLACAAAGWGAVYCFKMYNEKGGGGEHGKDA